MVGHQLGVPVETGGSVFVPDFTAETVWVVSSRGVARQTPRLLPSTGSFDLITGDGLVFFNDPDSEKAGVIAADATVRPIVKYDLNALRPPPSQPPTSGPTSTTLVIPTPTPTFSPSPRPSGTWCGAAAVRAADEAVVHSHHVGERSRRTRKSGSRSTSP